MQNHKSVRKIVFAMFVVLATLFISACVADPATSSSGGCGTVMGCCPATGCSPPTSWYGSSSGTCFTSSSSCGSGGNSNCRQCY
jgi:hypothetical protein